MKEQPFIAVWLSIVSNMFLTLIKLLVGSLFNSPVILADGIHNAGDIIASVAAYTSMSISKKPADSDHPYGHGKAEVLCSMFVSFILIIASFYIAYEAIQSFYKPPHTASIIALITAFISLFIKQILYMYTIKIAQKHNSKALISTAYDHLADVYASIASLLGIGLTFVGEYYHISILTYGDPFASIVVSVLILKMVFHMSKEAIDVLMDKIVDQEKIKDYHSLILSILEVKRIDRLRAREHGHYILVDVRVSIPAHFNVQEGHDISRKIKETIMEQHSDVDEVLVHLNPWYE
jgi:cation diffusion facilitator family transporter